MKRYFRTFVMSLVLTLGISVLVTVDTDTTVMCEQVQPPQIVATSSCNPWDPPWP